MITTIIEGDLNFSSPHITKQIMSLRYKTLNEYIRKVGINNFLLESEILN